MLKQQRADGRTGHRHAQSGAPAVQRRTTHESVHSSANGRGAKTQMVDSTPLSVSRPSRDHYDVIIVGSGMGGGTLAYALKDTGASVLLVERGGFVPQEPQNWDAGRCLRTGTLQERRKLVRRFQGRAFQPRHLLLRRRQHQVLRIVAGAISPRRLPVHRTPRWPSPAWPFDYDDFAPHYSARRTGLQGSRRHSTTRPCTATNRSRSRQSAMNHPSQAVADELRQTGPDAVAHSAGHRSAAGWCCIRCATCDGFPCRVLAKIGRRRCLCSARASQAGNVELLTDSLCRTSSHRRVRQAATGVQMRRSTGTPRRHGRRQVVVSCGAVNSAALLLRSANDHHPQGLANSSGLVGRTTWCTTTRIMVAINPLRKNKVGFPEDALLQRLLPTGTPDFPYPLGHVQLIGKLQGAMLKRPKAPHSDVGAEHGRPAAASTGGCSAKTCLTPRTGSRLRARRHHPDRAGCPTTSEPTRCSCEKCSELLRKMGYPLMFTETHRHRRQLAPGRHRAGRRSTPLRPCWTRTAARHDVDNLFVVDSAFFPSLPVMNPALTIAANAFRVAPAIVRGQRQALLDAAKPNSNR